MKIRVRDIQNILQQIAPKEFAYDWDNVGLLVGDAQAQVTGIAVALDLTAEAIDGALAVGANLLVTHHPVFFGGGVTHLTEVGGDSSLILRLVREGIHLIAVHTNWDVAPGGVNDVLAGLVGLTDCRPLQPHPQQPFVKLTTYLPEDSVQQVLQALAAAGAGELGEYSHCSFAAPGSGRFLPLAGAHPAVGQVGELTSLPEVRVEVLLPNHKKGDVVAALLAAHPYETPAFDLMPVDIQSVVYGLGRIGRLPQPVRLADYAARVAAVLDCDTTQVVGDPEAVIADVAVCGGSGDSLLPDALAAGAQVFITGEVGYHKQLWAVTQGLALIVAGHDCTERVSIKPLCECLQSRLDAVQYTLRVYAVECSRPVWAVRREQ